MVVATQLQDAVAVWQQLGHLIMDMMAILGPDAGVQATSEPCQLVFSMMELPGLHSMW